MNQTGPTEPSAPASGYGPSLGEFIAWLRSRATDVEFVPSYYLDGHRHSGLQDAGDSYCWGCVQKERWLNRHNKEPYTCIRREHDKVCDSSPFCDRCYSPLDHSPTEYYIESEIEHWAETDGEISATDALLLENMICNGGWDEEQHWPMLAPIAARMITHNSGIDGPPSSN